MSERSHKATVAKASEVADRLGDDYKVSSDPAVNEQRSMRRRERRRRALADQDKNIWAECVSPDCNLMAFSTLRSGIPFPICSLHAAAVWESVEEALNERDIMMVASLDALRARREVLRAEWRKQEEAEQAEFKAELVRPDCPGQIYYIRANGLIKVGFTTNITQRLRHYGANAELLAHYPATRADETNLHRQLSPSRAKGREWYHDDPVIQAFVYRATREHGQPTAEVKWTEPAKSKVRAKTWRG